MVCYRKLFQESFRLTNCITFIDLQYPQELGEMTIFYCSNDQQTDLLIKQRSSEVEGIKQWDTKNEVSHDLKQNTLGNSSTILHPLKWFATFWEFSFYRQKKVAEYEYYSLLAEKIHFHT